MKKQVRQLISIWLAVLMMFGMLPVSAAAETEASEGVSVGIWAQPAPVIETLNSLEVLPDESYEMVRVDTDTPLKGQVKAYLPDDADLLGWRAWTGGSGVLFFNEYGNNVTPNDILDENFLFLEPILSNVRISGESDADEYTAAADVYTVRNDTIGWYSAKPAEPGLSYQWYKQTACEPTTRELQVSQGVYTVGGKTIPYVEVTITLKSGDTMTIATSEPCDFTFGPYLARAEVHALTLVENDDELVITNETAEALTYYVFADGVDSIATVDVTAAVPLEGRTSASLNDGNAAPLTSGSYLCKVSYDSDTSVDTNRIYTAWSEPVAVTTNAITLYDTNGETTGGKYSVDKTTAAEGEIVTITATPDGGYAAVVSASAMVNSFSGYVLTVTRTSDTTYTFAMPAYPVDVEVDFFQPNLSVTCDEDTFYPDDLAEAFEIAEDLAEDGVEVITIKVERDYVEPGADVYFNNYASVTLDLNGHHVYFEDTFWINTPIEECSDDYQNEVGSIWISQWDYNSESEEGKLSLTDSSEGKTGFLHAMLEVMYGTLRVDSGKYYGVVFPADTKISGGTFLGMPEAIIANAPDSLYEKWIGSISVFPASVYYPAYEDEGSARAAMEGIVAEGCVATNEVVASKSPSGCWLAGFPANTSVIKEYTITVTTNPAEGGTVTGDGTYHYGAPVTLTATPNTGYQFVNWTEGGSVVSTNAIYNITADTDVNLVANFAPYEYKVTFNANSGSVSSTSTNVTFGGKYGTLPEPTRSHYTFSGWNTAEDGNGIPVTADTTVATAGDHTLYAQWTPKLHCVCGDNASCGSEHAPGTEWAPWNSTESLPAAGTYYLTSDVRIPNNQTHTVTGELNLCLNGYSITTGGKSKDAINVNAGAELNICDCSANGTGAIRVTYDNKNAINNFGTVTVYGGTIEARNLCINNSGTVTVLGGKIHCPTTGYGIRNEGTGSATVSGGTVSSNEGHGIYNNGTGSVTVNGTGTAKGGSGSYGIYNNSTGSVTVSGGSVTGAHGIYNASRGNVTVSGGSVTGTNTSGYGIRNYGSGTVTVSGTGSVSSTGGGSWGIYNEGTGTVTVSNGTVNGVLYGINNKSSGTVTVSGGTVTGTGGSGYGIRNNNSSGTVTVSGSANVSGNQYGIYNYGTLNLSGGPTITGSSGTSIYTNQPFTVTGALTGENNSIVVNMSGTGVFATNGAPYISIFKSRYSDKKIVADGNDLKLVEKTITITANASEGGGVEGGGSYNYGESVTLTATPAAGYKFVKWTKGGEQVSTNPTYTFKAEASCTLVANFERDTYTIKFVNEDGTELQSSEVACGETPVYTGETPTKAATAQYSYTFAGWTPAIEAVSGDATYTATYTSTVNEYTIKFVNEDGTELQSSKVAYGETPVYTGETPTKAGNAQYTYTFDGWTPEIAAVTGDATYTATYTETVNKYTVTFYDEDGTTVLESKEWEYGQNPVYNNGQNPTKQATAEKTYTFAGWNPGVVMVTSDASYTATFTDATNFYTVTWYDEDGTTVLETASWAYGSVPSSTAATPIKEADAEYTYAFKEWVAMSGLDSHGKVTGDASFKASYTATKIDYTGTVSPEEGTMENVTVGGLGEVAEEINKNIVLTVKVEAADANDTEQTAIKGQAGSRTLEFLDITLKDDGGNSVEVPQSTVLEIVIPFTMGNKQNIAVYRHHNGIAAAFTALNTRPAADARTDATFYVDSANHCIYVYTNQFSTYAIGYTVLYYPATYSVVVENAVNGTVKANPSYATSGSTVTVTVTPDKGYVLDKLTVTDIFGREVDVAVKDGKYTFKMPAAKVTVKATFKEEVAFQNPFEDVFATDYYYDAVLWAVKEGITNGTSATTFSPNAPCTRAQMITFLWRAVGSPEPTATTCPFTDVDMDSYYGKAVLWAAENGITKGTSDTTFSPDMECSRAQMATFLCRMAGGKAESDTIAFTDIKADAYYAESVQWAVENGITNGTGDNKFSPDATCTRGQMVTFLYRYYVNQ